MSSASTPATPPETQGSTKRSAADSIPESAFLILEILRTHLAEQITNVLPQVNAKTRNIFISYNYYQEHQQGKPYGMNYSLGPLVIRPAADLFDYYK